MLRCKFRLSKVSKTDTSRVVQLYASDQKTGDNKDWSQYTPSGSLQFTVTNEAAFERIDQMKEGDHFWLDLSLVQEQA